MAEPLTPNEVAEASACWCLPDVLPSVLYELDAIRVALGGDVMTPNEVAEASACWCVPDFNRAALYLLEQVATNSGNASNNISGAGSPVGVVTPDAVNQFYRDTTGTGLWQSTGLTSADWINWI